MSKHEFQTEVSQLLNLMINSLYSNKEIFLRELISNSSDALDKLKYLKLTDEKFKDFEYEPKIEIKANKDDKTIIISDNGIGMDQEDLQNSLGTIAKSGTKAFIEQLQKEKNSDNELIGQFGVGFYSAFMVANKIEVVTKKAGCDQAYRWSSSAGDSYEIDEVTKEDVGTSMTLYLKDDADEYLQEYRLESIISKYSNHIPFPIYLEKTKEEDDKKEQVLEQVNKASAIWRLNKSELKKDDYKNFYSQTFHDSEEPLLYTHTKAEGTLEYSTLFYIPKKAPFDIFRVDYQSGLKLYVKRVFISDDDKELLPTYLRFVRGIIDVEDLPLNVSREILQENIILTKVKQASVKKILNELKKLKKKDFDKYKEFYLEFGKVLKEGIMGEFENRELLLDLLLFKTSKSDELIDLETYLANMDKDQKEIFYLIGEDASVLKNSPHIEDFNEKGIEVLLLDDEVDTIVIPQVGTYKEKSLKSVTEVETDKDDSSDEESKKEFAQILVKMKEHLKDDVKDVKISTRLKKSSSCLVYDKNDPDFTMQQMLKQMGQSNLPPVKPILEINPNHQIFSKLKDSDNLAKLASITDIVFGLAKLNEGMKLEDPLAFSNSINELIVKSL
jgi:molecular chaperone HtpG